MEFVVLLSLSIIIPFLLFRLWKNMPVAGDQDLDKHESEDLSPTELDNTSTQERRSNLVILRSNLLTKVLGNHRTLHRLIEYEKSLNPNASDVALYTSAIERWENDNRL